MITKSILLAVIAVHLAYGKGLPPSSVTQVDNQPPDNVWTLAYYHELDEIDDEISAFEVCLNQMNSVCQLPNATKLCTPYIELVKVALNRTKFNLDYVEKSNVGEKKKRNFPGRRNKLAMVNMGEVTYINFEMITTFRNISILNMKIYEWRNCSNCHIYLTDFDEIINAISTNLKDKVYKLKQTLFSFQSGVTKSPAILITQQQFNMQLKEFQNIFRAHSPYEITDEKMDNPTMTLDKVFIEDNQFFMKLTIPLQIKKEFKKKLLNIRHN